jgi:acyl transferase domain-containing protein
VTNHSPLRQLVKIDKYAVPSSKYDFSRVEMPFNF